MIINATRRLYRFCRGWGGATLLLCAGCAGAPSPDAEPPTPPPSAAAEFRETPAPAGAWRGHRLSRCPDEPAVPALVEKRLGICSQYFREGSGSDGMIELEMTLDEGHRHPLILLTLGQLYVMAGQGVPWLLPAEGPAADTGDHAQNKVRLLGRAELLLEEAAAARPEDAAVDYLLADVARSRGRMDEAAALVERGHGKCTGGRSFAIMQLYQELNRYPARLLSSPPPDYPQEVIRRGVSGKVVLDLLLDPAGAPRQAVVVESPDPALAAAATAAFRASSYEAARLGKYPVWAWLRVHTNFSLTAD